MSRTTAAVSLLLISLPLAFSLPKDLPPFKLLNATETFSSPTGEPAPILDPGFGDGNLPDVTVEATNGTPIPIEPGIGDDTGPEIFIDPLLPVDPVPGPIPTVTIPLDPALIDTSPVWPVGVDPALIDPIPTEPIGFVPPNLDGTTQAPSVSIKNFLSIIQPLLDIIGDLFDSLPGSNALVRPFVSPYIPKEPLGDVPATWPLQLGSTRASRFDLGKRNPLPEASSDALSKFYASLTSNQGATLRESFEVLDDDTKAKVLSVLESEPVRLELAKRDGGFVSLGFITKYTNEFRYLNPLLAELRPEIAQGLQDVLDDPTIPLPSVGSLDLDDLPDQLKQFVLDMYPFFSLLSDGAVPDADKKQILENLSDGLSTKKRDVNTKRAPQDADNIIVNAPTWDYDRVRHAIDLFRAVDPALFSLGDEEEEIYNLFYDPKGLPNVDIGHFAHDLEGQGKYDEWLSYQIGFLLDSLPETDRDQLYEILDLDTAPSKRAIRRAPIPPPPPPADNIVLNGPTWSDDRVRYVLDLFHELDPAIQSLLMDKFQLYDPFNNPNSPPVVDFEDFAPGMKGQAQNVVWQYYQFELLLNSLPPAEAMQLIALLNLQTVSSKRAMRRGLRIRQEDSEGDDLDFALGPDGSLDPFEQNHQHVGDQFDIGSPEEGADGPSSESLGSDDSEQFVADPSADGSEELDDSSDSNPTAADADASEDPAAADEDDAPSTDSSDFTSADADASEEPAAAAEDDAPSTDSSDFTSADEDDVPFNDSNDSSNDFTSADADVSEDPAVIDEDQAPSTDSFDPLFTGSDADVSEDSAPGNSDSPPTVADADASEDSITSSSDSTSLSSNVDLQGAFVGEINDNPNPSDVNPNEEKLDLESWATVHPSSINDIVQGDLAGEWNTNVKPFDNPSNNVTTLTCTGMIRVNARDFS
ncbi:uncharacterized protein K460DRAFT_437879 [Cucurbitaria berberidis CBS 394.84]|uniref:Uncharacterized protein n=1 Tax=Cucurbitaria berberidis CBS 394.84 TaxID=1168544 RepID=A0A9P4G6J2_9PLEO|nr:uncharacterized protein K460DRAFT_437879 [Cucurbitaria berberidis CBS 394.84]KAF1839928.1 hypothetical protein K460DRAFT_437879 [Cucurbitaria berberidis CBS 394.84]